MQVRFEITQHSSWISTLSRDATYVLISNHHASNHNPHGHNDNLARDIPAPQAGQLESSVFGACIMLQLVLDLPLTLPPAHDMPLKQLSASVMCKKMTEAR